MVSREGGVVHERSAGRSQHDLHSGHKYEVFLWERQEDDEMGDKGQNGIARDRSRALSSGGFPDRLALVSLRYGLPFPGPLMIRHLETVSYHITRILHQSVWPCA